MKLARALRLVGPGREHPAPRLALTGAGGKTSALFRLGRELLHDPAVGSPASVLLTASTHLSFAQFSLADHAFIIERADDLRMVEESLPEGTVLLIGPEVEPERMRGLDAASLDRLGRLAEARGLPLLVEADGSRRRPLKAPAAHEPPVPAWVNIVAVVAGLRGLGQPLDDEWVHRAEIFAALSGLPLGETVTSQALARVLVHPAGGLKGIPAGARRAALLNAADTAELQAAAGGLAEQLLGAYHAVLVARLGSAFGEEPVLSVYEPIAGVVLAAGESQRLGRPKQLLEWRGEPLVRHVARTALASGLSEVVVVTGAAGQAVSAALEGLPVKTVYNPDWAAGQSTSLVTGLRSLSKDPGGVLFFLADQPQVPPTLVRSLVNLHRRTLAPLVAPQADGLRANPVLFDRVTFPDLLATTGDTGGRALFARFRPEWLPWHDASLLLDVDTEDDYRRLLELE